MNFTHGESVACSDNTGLLDAIFTVGKEYTITCPLAILDHEAMEKARRPDPNFCLITDDRGKDVLFARSIAERKFR